MRDITEADIQKWADLLFVDENRGEFYWQYFKASGEYQSVLQAMITTYSGAFGGFAVTGNYAAKLSRPDLYTETLDDFSVHIAQKTFESVAAAADRGYILNAEEMLLSDYNAWGTFINGNEDLKAEFPGILSSNLAFGDIPRGAKINFLIESRDKSKYFDPKVPLPYTNKYEDVEIGAWELGNRYDEFSEDQYIKLDASWDGGGDEEDSNMGRFYRVYEKLENGDRGNLVFVADREITFDNGPDDKILIEVAENQRDNISALQEGSPKYIARQKLWEFTQSNYQIR